MEISDDLFFNIVKDWEKKEISTEEKGKLINAYLEDNRISQRKLAELLNVPHSTLHDWVSGRQKEKYYNNKRNELDFLLDRLLFVLTRKNWNKSEKTEKLLRQLKKELELFEV